MSSDEVVLEVSFDRCARHTFRLLSVVALLAGGAALGFLLRPSDDACLSLVSELRYEEAPFNRSVHHFKVTSDGMMYNHDLVMDADCHEPLKRHFPNANDPPARRRMQAAEDDADVCYVSTGLGKTFYQNSSSEWKAISPRGNFCCSTYGYCYDEALNTFETFPTNIYIPEGEKCIEYVKETLNILTFRNGKWSIINAECCEKDASFKDQCPQFTSYKCDTSGVGARRW